MKRTWWISLRAIKCHEFNSTFRLLERDNSNWAKKFNLLRKLEKSSIKQFFKFGAQLTLAYLILSSLQSGISLAFQVSEFSVSLPIAYFLALASFVFLFTVISFCHLAVVMTLKARESGKILIPGFSTNAYALITGDDDDMSLGIPLHLNRFLKELIPVLSVLSAGLLVSIVVLLIPLFAFGGYLLHEQSMLLENQNIGILEWVAALLGNLVVAFGALYLVLFFVPLPFRKDRYSIRWGFLYNLPRSGRHPQSHVWLDERKKN